MLIIKITFRILEDHGLWEVLIQCGMLWKLLRLWIADTSYFLCSLCLLMKKSSGLVTVLLAPGCSRDPHIWCSICSWFSTFKENWLCTATPKRQCVVCCDVLICVKAVFVVAWWMESPFRPAILDIEPSRWN